MIFRLAVVYALAAAPCPSTGADAAEDEGALHALLGAAPTTLTSADDTATFEERRRRASRRLSAACALSLTPTDSSAPDARRLTAILDRPEFEHARDRRDVVADLVERFFEWLRGLMAFPAVERFSYGTRTFVLVLALGVVLAVGVRLLGRRRGSPLAPAARGAEGVSAPLLRPEDHLRRARDALGAKTRDALREGLLGLLSLLESRHWARADRVRTNKEIGAELSRRGAPGDIARDAEQLLRQFDRAFYSLDPVTEPEARAFLDAVAGLLTRAGSAA